MNLLILFFKHTLENNMILYLNSISEALCWIPIISNPHEHENWRSALWSDDCWESAKILVDLVDILKDTNTVHLSCFDDCHIGMFSKIYMATYHLPRNFSSFFHHQHENDYCAKKLIEYFQNIDSSERINTLHTFIFFIFRWHLLIHR